MSDAHRTAVDACKKFSDLPTRTIARMLNDDHPDLFPTIEKARGCVRQIRGNKGKVNREKSSTKAIHRENGVAGDIADQPEENQRRPESTDIVERSDDLSITYYGSEVKTVDDLIRKQEIDLRLWEIVEKRINNWEVAGKRSQGQDEQKRWKADTIWKTGLRQITIKLKRRAPKPIQDAIKDLLADVKPLKPSKPIKRELPSPHLMEIGIYDHHFGKLCWGEESGTDYDMGIAKSVFDNAIDSMLAYTKMFPVKKIVIPIGNDFFHVNDWLSQTANGTRVESVDDRFSKVFRIGVECMQSAVQKSLKQAESVEVKWVPGNHDRNTSWFLCEVLSAKFKADTRVIFDVSPKERKYLRYGPTLLGWVHGDETKPQDLPSLMAHEAKCDWSETEYHIWHTGHFHKRKETRYTAGDTFHGVEVRVMPSLCGTDQWHYRKGFTGNARMAETWLWSRKTGPVGHFVVNS